MQPLIRLNEPTLLFGHGQAMEDPRDGLTLFGPLDEGKPYGIKAGVIGRKDRIRRFKEWVKRIQGPISNDKPQLSRPPFPGFEAAFRIPWDPEPALHIEILDDELDCIYLDDKYQRVYETVNVYSSKIVEAITEEETKIDIWFVIVPDEVYKYCRPKSIVEANLRIAAEGKMSPNAALKAQSMAFMFQDMNEDAVPYQYEVNFHNQLKARLLKDAVLTQIIRE